MSVAHGADARNLVPLSEAVAELIERSDLLDLSLRLRLHAWRDGYREGARGQYEAGYAAAIADVKAAQHALFYHLRGLREIEDRHWTVRGEQRTRKTFGSPHRNDFTGQDGAA